MTAFSPCPLAMNITAIAYIGKDIEEKRKVFYSGLYYTLGRALSYTGLGLILYLGASKFYIARFLQLYGERILGPLLLLIGIVMLDILRLRMPSFSKLTESVSSKKMQKGLSALLLGLVFALAFCPSSAVFYFGMLIPMSAASSAGYLLPVIFAFATGLPVIIVAWILAYSVAGIGKFYDKMKAFQKWFNIVVALIFILTGIYYAAVFYF